MNKSTYSSGTLTTYQDNYMSLSCRGSIDIANGKIVSVEFKGMPRTNGDAWTSFYKRAKRNDIITPEEIKRILMFNGHMNVVSVFTPKKPMYV